MANKKTVKRRVNVRNLSNRSHKAVSYHLPKLKDWVVDCPNCLTQNSEHTISADICGYCLNVWHA